MVLIAIYVYLMRWLKLVFGNIWLLMSFFFFFNSNSSSIKWVYMLDFVFFIIIVRVLISKNCS